MADLNFITDDWKRIPLNLKYLIAGGVFLIFNAWLLDHWRNDGTLPYRLFGIFDIRSFSYSAGFVLIFLAFAILIIKQFSILKGKLSFRAQYPLDKLDDTFHLVWFNGRLYLFDNLKKKYFHVYPWETAQDLLFAHLGITNKAKSPDESDQLIEFPNGKKIKTSEFSNGGPINTQV